MESSGAGALASQAAPLSDHPHTQYHHDSGLEPVIVDDESQMRLHNFSFPGPTDGVDTLNTPIHRPSINHFQASHLRESIEEQLVSSPISHDAANAANILANGQPFNPFQDDLAQYELSEGNIYDHYTNQLDSMVDPFEPDPTEEELLDGSTVDSQRENMRAYAKLVLPDGDFYVTSQKVIIGRDMDCFRRYNRELRKAALMEVQAQQALEEYKKEPSQPSQPEDVEAMHDASAKSNDSLEGRPAAALPSNYSEQGGAVSYAALSENEFELRRKKRKRKLLQSKSSSTTSITPANLHPSMTNPSLFAENGGILVDENASQFLPVHTVKPEHLRKISKEHLIIEYNGDEGKWELEVVGRTGAFVNNVLHPAGNVVFLSHNDEISMASSLRLVFKLPDVARQSPEESEILDDSKSALGTSPVRRLSNAIDVDDDDEDDEEVEKANVKPKPKLTLKLKKAAPTSKDKGQKKPKEPEKAQKSLADLDAPKQVASTEMSPEAVKKAEKDKKPKAAAKEPETQPKEEPAVGAATTPPPPAVPTNLEPGSIFEGVAAEELPQKRKGPGRPPKNGLISKRDQSFVKRKLKEYEKRGEAPPPMDTLVAIVRAENKAKEAAAKATQRGEAPPDMPGVMQSIEIDPSLNMQRSDAFSMTDMTQLTSATPMEPIRKSPPGPKRIARSLSPMKQENEYTEEELKKPTITYVHILDEVLRAHPEGRADLQEIYDLICKRYPFYKYRTGTAGWQSSVRHNLLQHERFRENGRSGKGRLWSVNYDCPLEKEKKRRPSPPARGQMPMQNGQYPPNQMQYGQPQYNTQYNQAGMNGQPPYNPAQPGSGSYYSPYAPSQNGSFPQGPPGAAHMPAPGQPNNARTSGTPQYPSNPQQSQPRPPAAQPAPQFQGIVDEIMQYRTRYLAGFAPDSDEFKQREETFKKCTDFLSDFFHGNTDRPEADVKSDEQRRVFEELKVIFNRYEYLREPHAASATPAADAGATAGTIGPPATAPRADGAPGGAANGGQPTGTGPAATDVRTVQPSDNGTASGLVKNEPPVGATAAAPVQIIDDTLTIAGPLPGTAPPTQQVGGASVRSQAPAPALAPAVVPAAVPAQVRTSVPAPVPIQAPVVPPAQVQPPIETAIPAQHPVPAPAQMQTQSHPAVSVPDPASVSASAPGPVPAQATAPTSASTQVQVPAVMPAPMPTSVPAPATTPPVTSAVATLATGPAVTGHKRTADDTDDGNDEASKRMKKEE